MRVLFLMLFTFANFSYATTLPKKQLNCLVDNAYHEARGEGTLGILLVSQTVLNRAKEKKKSICETVYASKQYSWTSKSNTKIPLKERERLQRILVLFSKGLLAVPQRFRDAYYFHHIEVKPYWSKNFIKCGKWKNHVFYLRSDLRKSNHLI